MLFHQQFFYSVELCRQERSLNGVQRSVWKPYGSTLVFLMEFWVHDFKRWALTIMKHFRQITVSIFFEVNFKAAGAMALSVNSLPRTELRCQESGSYCSAIRVKTLTQGHVRKLLTHNMEGEKSKVSYWSKISRNIEAYQLNSPLVRCWVKPVFTRIYFMVGKFPHFKTPHEVRKSIKTYI